MENFNLGTMKNELVKEAFEAGKVQKPRSNH